MTDSERDARVASRHCERPLVELERNRPKPFAMIDPRLWEATRHSPIRVLEEADPARLAARVDDHDFQQVTQKAIAARDHYYETAPWFQRVASNGDEEMLVAYFCSEFAIHEACNSIREVSACSPATTSRVRPTSECPSSGSACSTARVLHPGVHQRRTHPGDLPRLRLREDADRGHRRGHRLPRSGTER